MDAMEVERIAFALAQMLRGDRLSPDEAYIWTRYVAEGLRALRQKVDEDDAVVHGDFRWPYVTITPPVVASKS